MVFGAPPEDTMAPGSDLPTGNPCVPATLARDDLNGRVRRALRGRGSLRSTADRRGTFARVMTPGPFSLSRPAAAVGLVTAALALAACGGGERQDADEPEGTFAVEAKASFPERQQIAGQEELEVTVRNAGQEAVPNVAVSVDSFTTASEQQGMADEQQPVWIVDEGPVNGTTAYTSTWALGRLAPGQTKTFTWKVTAIRPGKHEVKWRVAAGLDGKAKAQTPSGQVPQGTFSVDVSDTPRQTTIDPDTGEVVEAKSR